MKFLNILAVCTTLLTLPNQSWANNNGDVNTKGGERRLRQAALAMTAILLLIKKGGQR